jgi:hypothetical protein
MADRELNRDATLYVDFPYRDGMTVTLTLTNPVGADVLSLAATDDLGRGRFAYTHANITPAGVWLARWIADNGKIIEQEFTVGERGGKTKYELFESVANRVGHTHLGVVSTADEDTVTDDTLVAGSGNYIAQWLTFGPEQPELMGRAYRVRQFNGSALVVTPPFPVLPEEGTRFILTNVQPREIENAVISAFEEVKDVARIEVLTTGILFEPEGTSTYVTVPRGMSHVNSINFELTEYGPATWAMSPNRRIAFLTTIPTTTIARSYITGIRQARPPVWMDSWLDFDPATMEAATAAALHFARAAGQGVDREDHLRRALSAEEQYQAKRRLNVGRLPPGLRAVLE